MPDPSWRDKGLDALSEPIRADAAAARFAAWGESTVVDELTREPVLPVSLFDDLHRMARLQATWPVGNAGLIHVYGYLLSTVDTPYGAKGDRWTKGGVARALGRHPDEFVPWFAGPSTPLERLTSAIAPIITAPGGFAGTVLWIEESSAAVTATTVVVRSGSGDCAILYAVNASLITAFPIAPISSAWIDALLEQPPRLRYNAVAGSARVPLDNRRVCLRRE